MSGNIKTGKEISQNIFDITISWSENPYLMNVPEQLKKETQIKWVSLSKLKKYSGYTVDDALELLEEEEKQ